MTSTQRVMTAINHKIPDRIPLFDGYWAEFVEVWRRYKGFAPGEVDIDDYYGVDLQVCVADESPWPSRAAVLEETSTHLLSRNGWGALHRSSNRGYFFEEVELPLRERTDLDKIEFESPRADCRYVSFESQLEAATQRGRCPFCKVGGPYLRPMNMRGIEQWLVDIAEDPVFATELASRVTDHLIEIGCESLRRGNLHETGVWIYDDIASNDSVMVGRRSYEKIFLPLMQRLVSAFKQAGASKVVLHSDGNFLEVLDSFLDIGIDAINPVEPKAGMDLPRLKEKYGDRLAFIGGVDNSHVLPRGTQEEIRTHVTRLVEAARSGGVILGSHSIGPDISPASYDYAIGLIRNSPA